MTHSHSFNYKKVNMIGSGGTSVVYLAEDQDSGETVAIKLIAKDVSENEKFRGRFEREIEMLKKVQHPNILPIIDHGETDGQLYIVMPYISGGSVQQLLELGPINWEKMVEILEQVCPALDKMHEMGFIHRDVKPHNILLGEDGHVWLSDFGISRPIDLTPDQSVTHTLDIVGTPQFIAPEQAADGELSAQTDIYQLGVTTFNMLTGQRLFDGTALQVIAKHIGEKPGSAGQIVEGLPRNIDAVLHMALAKDPDDRFRTAGDFLSALQLLGDQNTVTFQHLPGFPLRANRPQPEVLVVDDLPAEPAYEPILSAASLSSSEGSAGAVSATSASRRKGIVYYALAGAVAVALAVGGVAVFDGVDTSEVIGDFIGGNGNGGNGGRGNNGGGGGRNGNGNGNGGQGAEADINEDSEDGVDLVVEAEEPIPTEAEVVEADIEAQVDAEADLLQVVASAPVSNVVESAPENTPSETVAQAEPVQAVAIADTDGNGGNGGNGGDGNGRPDNNNQRPPRGNDGNGGDGNGGDGNGGNRGDGNGRGPGGGDGEGGRGNGNGNGGNGNGGGRGN